MKEDFVICPFCGTPQDKPTLYRNDCMCTECGAYIDTDNTYDDMYWGDCWDDETDYYEKLLSKLEKKKGEDNDMNIPIISNDEEETVQTPSFVFRFITKADYETIKQSFEVLHGDIDYMSLEQDGPIREYLKTTGGLKLKKGLGITDDYDEYIVEGSFIFGDADNEDKKILISTLCQFFPLFITREEGSSYIMTNNKGLAKGIVDMANEDQIEILSQYMTGYEKYQVLVNFLYWAGDPYKTKSEADIMMKWINNSLISLKLLRSVKQVSMEWIAYLASLNEIQISISDKDPGTMVPFERMLEDCCVHVGKEDEKLVNVISLRGIGEFALEEERGNDDISENEKK